MTFKMTAERYATALYEVAAAGQELDTVKEDIQTIADLFEALPEVRRFCLSMTASVADSQSMVEVAFLPLLKSQLTRNSLTVMAENLRLPSLPFISDAFWEICAEKENRLPVTAEFSHTPDESVVSELGHELERRTGKTVELSTEINPSLLGGFIIKWKNRMIDSSVRNRLKQLRRKLEA